MAIPSKYENEDGYVGSAEVQQAIEDWRNDELGSDVLVDVISRWRNEWLKADFSAGCFIETLDVAVSESTTVVGTVSNDGTAPALIDVRVLSDGMSVSGSEVKTVRVPSGAQKQVEWQVASSVAGDFAPSVELVGLDKVDNEDPTGDVEA